MLHNIPSQAIKPSQSNVRERSHFTHLRIAKLLVGKGRPYSSRVLDGDTERSLLSGNQLSRNQEHDLIKTHTLSINRLQTLVRLTLTKP
jgi:hypothetical protein